MAADGTVTPRLWEPKPALHVLQTSVPKSQTLEIISSAKNKLLAELNSSGRLLQRRDEAASVAASTRLSSPSEAAGVFIALRPLRTSPERPTEGFGGS